MPRIFDNIELKLLPSLTETLKLSYKADFCVGYFNLRGWKQLLPYIENWTGFENNQCRLLIGMNETSTEEDLKNLLNFSNSSENIDRQKLVRYKHRLTMNLREQLTLGIPTHQDEMALKQLVEQLRSKKLVVKLFVKHKLHAKLYLLYRNDPNNPVTGFLGSSNLTMAGLSNQGELNVDVLDHDATLKLQKWFEDRWNDSLGSIDVSMELVQVILESWAGQKNIPPYYIYLKMAYHLSREARAGFSEFSIPKEFQNKLLEFQEKAVQLSAHHLKKRGGVIIGDVVGLGKTIMASTLVKILKDTDNYRTLIICPKNLVTMWEDYDHKYDLGAKVISISKVQKELPALRRYQVVLIDESHSLRNKKGSRYKIVYEYIRENDSKCIMLSATPYNKTYHDLSNQIRLFISEDKDLSIKKCEFKVDEKNKKDQYGRLYSVDVVDTINSLHVPRYGLGKYKKQKLTVKPTHFDSQLAKDLISDSQALLDILVQKGNWDPKQDEKLNSLYNLITTIHKKDKVLVFTQFADTVLYLKKELESRGVDHLDCVTGDTEDPTLLAWRFSPESNDKKDELKKRKLSEIRVLISTDVLSEGQNLQDCHVVINVLLNLKLQFLRWLNVYPMNHLGNVCMNTINLQKLALSGL